MRRACIDIGSNTTRLLVADCSDSDLIECRQERAFTQIGRSLDADGRIPDVKLEEVVRAVCAQLAIARQLGVEQVRCVATAGVRRAANGGALVELVAQACGGLAVEVLSGSDEARLAFAGAAWGAGAGPETTLGVVDAGGGSSEIAVGTTPDRIRWWDSLALGSADVTAEWLSSDPPTAAEIAGARDKLEVIFAPLSPGPVSRVIAVGGSATSLRLLAGPTLDAEAFSFLLAAVQRLRARELALQFGVDPQRARLLGGGLLILEAVSKLFGLPLEIGRGGLREGLLLDAADHQ